MSVLKIICLDIFACIFMYVILECICYINTVIDKRKAKNKAKRKAMTKN